MVSAKSTGSQSPSSKPRTQLSSKSSSSDLSLGKALLKAALFTLVIWLILVVTTVGVVAWWGYQQFETFTTVAGTSWPELRALAIRGWNQKVIATNDHKNILVLGVDSLAGRGDVPPLTDTMLLVSLNLKTAQVAVLPLPRDLWSEPYQTKINALYAYGQERDPSRPWQFPQDVISDMTGVPLHHVVVVSIDQVAELIDMLGGIEVTIEEGFVDERFPRPDVDVTVERDPAKLYQRVEFEAGTEVMNGERALQYIRSRYASGAQGGDLARSRRQELVLQALLSKLKEPAVVTNVKLLGGLYRFYVEQFSPLFPIEQGIATLRVVWPLRHQVDLLPQEISIFPVDPNGSLLNPPLNPRQYQGQWVYTIRNADQFKTEVQTKLYSPQEIETTSTSSAQPAP